MMPNQEAQPTLSHRCAIICNKFRLFFLRLLCTIFICFAPDGLVRIKFATNITVYWLPDINDSIISPKPLTLRRISKNIFLFFKKYFSDRGFLPAFCDGLKTDFYFLVSTDIRLFKQYKNPLRWYEMPRKGFRKMT